MQRPILLVDQITCNHASRQSPEAACRMSEKLCFRNESRTPIVNLIRVLWDLQITTRINNSNRKCLYYSLKYKNEYFYSLELYALEEVDPTAACCLVFCPM